MRKILIIEDNDALRYMISLRLKYAGFPTETVTGVNEAKEYLKKECPLIVCTDVKLWDGNGLLLLSYIKRNYPALPVLVMSSYERDEYEAQAKRLGAESYIDKSEGTLMMETIINYANSFLPAEEKVFRYRILYISDSEKQIAEMQTNFAETEFRILGIRNQILAEDLVIKNIGVQLILCDANTELGGAMNLLYTFRNHSLFKRFCEEIPPCFVIADNATDDRERYISAGAEDVIFVPKDKGSIVRKVREFIEDGEIHKITINGFSDMPVITDEFLRPLLQVIRSSDLLYMVLNMRKMITEKYEEYFCQVINTNRGIGWFQYTYITNRLINVDDLYRIMERQILCFEVDGKKCFEKFEIKQEQGTAVIYLKCSEYLYQLCRNKNVRMKLRYSKNIVTELNLFAEP